MDPSFSESRILLDRIQKIKNRGNHQEALDLFMEHQQDFQRIPGSDYLKGTILFDMGQLDEALVCYKDELLRNPGFTSAHINMGVIYFGRGQYIEAVASLKLAVLTGGNQYLPYFNLANVMQVLGRHREAVIYYQRAIAIDPDRIDAYINVSPVYRSLGRLEDASKSYQEILRLDPGNLTATYMTAALNGEKIDRAPEGYVEDLFDDYAPYFDQKIMEELKYSVPEILSKIMETLPSKKRVKLGLDLGCGTGLGVESVGSFAETWWGVDLSAKMLDQAEGKGLYLKLIQAEILSFLKEHRDPKFGLVICLDTLPYLGDLEPLGNLLGAAVASKGLVALSFETYRGGSYQLEATGRYCHDLDYVKGVLDRAGFDICAEKVDEIRKQGTKMVRGAILVGKLRD